MSLFWTTAVVGVFLTPWVPADIGSSLEAHVVGIDGKPVATSSVLVWRLLPEAERPQRAAGSLWHEAGTGAVWENAGGAATGDRLRRDDLAPGTYRVTARQGHHQVTPVGISEPVVVGPDRGL